MCAMNLCKIACVFLAVAALVAFATSAGANTMTLVNGSFENPAMTGTIDTNVPTGWSLNPSCPGGSQRQEVGAGNFTAPTDGVAEWCFTSDRQTANNATGIEQNLGIMTTGDVYTLYGALCAYDAASNYGWAPIKDVFNVSFVERDDQHHAGHDQPDELQLAGHRSAGGHYADYHDLYGNCRQQRRHAAVGPFRSGHEHQLC